MAIIPTIKLIIAIINLNKIEDIPTGKLLPESNNNTIPAKKTTTNIPIQAGKGKK